MTAQLPTNKIELNSVIPMTYMHSGQATEKPLLIVLHGYTDSNSAALRRMYPANVADFEVLAPNGLFPVPARRGEVWKPAYAWYFADFERNAVLMHPEISAKAVRKLLEELNLIDRPKVLLGFSQGVFFIPHLLREIKNVRSVFAVGAAYRGQDYEGEIDFAFEALHGSEDEIIPLKVARSSFDEFVQSKCRDGKFSVFEGLKHTMNEESRSYLNQRLIETASQLRQGLA